jgi:cytokinin dehydrogenase
MIRTTAVLRDPTNQPVTHGDLRALQTEGRLPETDFRDRFASDARRSEIQECTMNIDQTVPALPPLPGLGGRLLTDQPSRERVASDLGLMVHEIPQAVLRPESAEDVATLLRAADEKEIPVAVRGRGRSMYGQTVARRGGVVIDMSSMNRIHQIEEDRCVVDAGATWTAVVEATVAQGLTPPTLTDFIDLSVGGTLSWAGNGPMTSHHGFQIDNVLSIEVVTTDGEIRECSPTTNTDLFESVLGGMGLIGVITCVTLRLIPAPDRVRSLRIPYADVATMQEDQLVLHRERRADEVEGLVAAQDGHWVSFIDASIYYSGDKEPDEDAVLRGLRCVPGATKTTDSTYTEFVTRLGTVETLPCGTGASPHAHPWWSTYTLQHVSVEVIEEIKETVDPAAMGPFDVVVTIPVRPAVSRGPLPPLPDTEWAFLVALFRCVDVEDQAELTKTLAENRGRFERVAAVDARGAADVIGGLGYTRPEWEGHFGDAWAALLAAKGKYDPHNVLSQARPVF